MCTCMHVYVCECACVLACMYMCECACVLASMYMYVSVHVYLRACICM